VSRILTLFLETGIGRRGARGCSGRHAERRLSTRADSPPFTASDGPFGSCRGFRRSLPDAWPPTCTVYSSSVFRRRARPLTGQAQDPVWGTRNSAWGEGRSREADQGKPTTSLPSLSSVRPGGPARFAVKGSPPRGAPGRIVTRGAKGKGSHSAETGRPRGRRHRSWLATRCSAPPGIPMTPAGETSSRLPRLFSPRFSPVSAAAAAKPHLASSLRLFRSATGLRPRLERKHPISSPDTTIRCLATRLARNAGWPQARSSSSAEGISPGAPVCRGRARPGRAHRRRAAAARDSGVLRDRRVEVHRLHPHPRPSLRARREGVCG
jgi:hypothetical protein